MEFLHPQKPLPWECSHRINPFVSSISTVILKGQSCRISGKFLCRTGSLARMHCCQVLELFWVNISLSMKLPPYSHGSDTSTWSLQQYLQFSATSQSCQALILDLPHSPDDPLVSNSSWQECIKADCWCRERCQRSQCLAWITELPSKLARA
ncbi:uncharacterized protein LJ206_005000 [Theristicus caerulescens]